MEAIDFERIERTFISRHWSFIRRECAPEDTIIGTLRELLPHIPSDSWEERLLWGGAYVNGKPVTADGPLPSPCRVEYYEPKFPIDDAASYFPAFDEGRIAFEDDDIMVYVKPRGLPSLPAREQPHHNLRTYLEHYSGSPVHMPSRLDLSTEGIVVASKTTRAHRPLQRLFETRSITKEYVLETSGAPRWSDLILETPIGKHPEHPVLRRVAEEGKNAVTRFELLRAADDRCLWLARPLTGRTHQLRVHASFLGHPIIGDNFYGGELAESLHLLAYRLRFRHPFTRTELEITTPPDLLPAWFPTTLEVFSHGLLNIAKVR